MSKKMLIVNLLLTAIVISWVIPAAVLGVTTDFLPKNEAYWTGTARAELKPWPELNYTRMDGVIIVGYTWPNVWDPQNWYRGFAKFDISTLPADACVSGISLRGTSMTATADHTLLVRRMTIDPTTTTNAETLFDGVGGGLFYASCSPCMRSGGLHSVTLPESAYAHLESAQGQGWFALGFTESGENTVPGMWQGHALPSPPILRVTYIVPPQSAPTPAISVDSICTGDLFCVTWNTVSGATSYEIREGTGSWLNVGASTQQCYTKTTTGEYTFWVRAKNSCGISGWRGVVIDVIDVPATMARPTASGSPYCTNVNYTISWARLTGVESYQIREDVTWINAGNTSQWTFNHSSAGSHNYWVRAVNMCGVGSSSPLVSVAVWAVPAAPSAPSASNAIPCPGEVVTISWAAIPGVTKYRLTDFIAGNDVYMGPNLEWSGPHQSGRFEYRLAVRANSCGWSNLSGPLFVTVQTAPAAPSAAIAVDSVCAGTQFCVTWNTISGATSYEIREDQLAWQNVGSSLSKCYTKSAVRVFSYSVRAKNSCGAGNPSNSVSVTVQVAPAAPAAPSASNATPCPDGEVTISWAAINGATEYRLTDFIAQADVYTGPNLEWSGPHPSGSFEYRLAVRANACGLSNFSGPVSVNVKQQLAAPGAPVSDQVPAIVDEPYTLSWDEVAGATYYELYEDGTALLYTGTDLETSMTRMIAGDFTYSVRACDECGCSDLGAELALTVDQQTAVEEIDALNLPGSYALSQNYPNPFNPETRIEFSLMRAGYVELTVYNVLGETIRSLVNGQLSAGYKAVIWDGHDNSGQQVSSGVYLYKLTTGEYTATRKMMLVK